MGVIWFIVFGVVGFVVFSVLIGVVREVWWAAGDRRAADLPRHKGDNRETIGKSLDDPNEGKPL